MNGTLGNLQQHKLDRGVVVSASENVVDEEMRRRPGDLKSRGDEKYTVETKTMDTYTGRPVLFHWVCPCTKLQTTKIVYQT